MAFNITPMTGSEILNRTFGLFAARLPAFLAIQLVVGLPTLVLQLAMPTFALGSGATLFLILPMVILGPIGSAAILRVIAKEYLGEPASLGEAFKFALERFLPLLGTSILMGLGVTAGVIACIVPGVYLAICWAFMSQVVVVENIAGPAALGRSRQLVHGDFGRVFLNLFLLGLVIGGLTIGLSLALGGALPHAQIEPVKGAIFPEVRLTSYANFATVQVVMMALNIPCQIFAAIFTTLLYFDMRNRKEAFNLAHLVAWSERDPPWRPESSTGSFSDADARQTGIQEPGNIRPPETGIKDAEGPAGQHPS